MASLFLKRALAWYAGTSVSQTLAGPSYRGFALRLELVDSEGAEVARDGRLSMRLYHTPDQKNDRVLCERTVTVAARRFVPQPARDGSPPRLSFTYHELNPVLATCDVVRRIEISFSLKNGEVLQFRLDGFEVDPDLPDDRRLWEPTHPERTIDLNPDTLLGLSSSAVLGRLGPPDEILKYNRMPSEGDVGWYGPRPQRLAAGACFRTWDYRNVRGVDWTIYFVPTPSIRSLPWRLLAACVAWFVRRLGEPDAEMSAALLLAGPVRVAEVGHQPSGAIY
jgi:hypothetical protein